MSAITRIYVWRFYDAPEEYRRLSTNGGDENWLVLIPSFVANSTWVTPSWIEAMGDLQRFKLEHGDIVYVGSHA